jgi:hypothetical protein
LLVLRICRKREEQVINVTPSTSRYRVQTVFAKQLLSVAKKAFTGLNTEIEKGKQTTTN